MARPRAGSDGVAARTGGLRLTSAPACGRPSARIEVGVVVRAIEVDEPGPVEARPLRLVERAVPEPGPGEVLVAVEVCGVCRTDLHVVEGDLAPRRVHIVPGHEVVGRIAGRGAGAARYREGDRVG